ncbi:hypothetical protein AMTR_s00086p00095220 [Amborella trichopoda]|uniref:DUF659 domain-containing protein n=1 Tax=Amborella trichopoda TaxID=13333 RepID=W1NYW7_AMBTC|nr:hypothetical protein AMTR_s00086p00095220 [Amborella trichopoda]
MLYPSGAVFHANTDLFHNKKMGSLCLRLVPEFGEDKVVQIIANNTKSYIEVVGSLIMKKRKHFVWSPCAPCRNLMLEAISEVEVKDRVKKAIYNHFILSLTGQHFEELIKPTISRYATLYLITINRRASTAIKESDKRGMGFSNCQGIRLEERPKKSLNDRRIWDKLKQIIGLTTMPVLVLQLVDKC